MSRTRYFLIVLFHSLLCAAIMAGLLGMMSLYVHHESGYHLPLALIVGAAVLSGGAGLGVGVEQADATSAEFRHSQPVGPNPFVSPEAVTETYFVTGKDVRATLVNLKRTGAEVVSSPIGEGDMYQITATFH